MNVFPLASFGLVLLALPKILPQTLKIKSFEAKLDCSGEMRGRGRGGEGGGRGGGRGGGEGGGRGGKRDYDRSVVQCRLLQMRETFVWL